MPHLTTELFLQIEMIGRCILAAICGALIGIERKNRLKEAGLRTHLIVALGSALMMCVSKYGFFDVLEYAGTLGVEVRLDPSRLASNIITGIGFLGAGTIFIRKQVVNGLTTAAGLWATAGIGMAIGAGMYVVGIAITVFLLLAQLLLHGQRRLLRSSSSDLVMLHVEDGPDIIKRVTEAFKEHDAEMVSIRYDKLANNLLEVECFVRLPKKVPLSDMVAELENYDFIRSVEI